MRKKAAFTHTVEMFYLARVLAEKIPEPCRENYENAAMALFSEIVMHHELDVKKIVEAVNAKHALVKADLGSMPVGGHA